MDYELLGRNIRAQRLALGWTQEHLAELIGVSTSFVGHIERGSRKASIDTLVAISNAMNVSVDSLLGSNLTSKASSLFPDNMTKAQKQVMSEILGALHGFVDQWDPDDLSDDD